jgi:type IV pilus assembly protein PilP
MTPRVSVTFKTLAVAAALVLAAGKLAAAQGAPAPVNPPAAGAAPAAPAGSQPAAPEPYSYDPAGRRDPFVSLLSRGMEPVPGGRRLTGLAGLATGELIVRGVLHSRGAYVAMVAGPDGKTYSARANDRLLDGVIRSVTPQGIIIMQDVNDPLSLVKQREVRKGLRTAEDAK